MTLESLKQKLLSNKEVKSEYDKIKLEFEIAKQIISIRKELQLTQREFAELIEMKQPQLARIESGKQLPRLDTLESICKSVGYSLEINFKKDNE